MKKRSRFYPRVQVDAAAVPAVGQAGGVLLTDTVAAAGLDTSLSTVLAPWRKPLAIHDPGKVVADLALTLALGGDCLADIALLRAQPGIYGRVASDPTVSRLPVRELPKPGGSGGMRRLGVAALCAGRGFSVLGAGRACAGFTVRRRCAGRSLRR